MTKLFFPEARAAYKTIRKMKITSVITQIMTGHGGFSEYLNRFKCKESPSCTCDPNEKESVPHVLLECPVFGRQRANLEIKLKIDLKIDT